MEQLSHDSVLRNALKVSRIQLPIHGSELEIVALLEAPVVVLQGLAVMEPSVSDASRITDLTAQHGAAAVQGILGLGLLGELYGTSLDGQNWKRGESGGE